MLSCRICGGSGSSAELSHVCKPMARAQMKQFIRRRCAHPGCPGTSLRIAIVRRMCHCLIQLLPRVWRIRNARHISCRHSGESGNPLALKINGFRLAPGSAGLAGMTAIYATNWRHATLADGADDFLDHVRQLILQTEPEREPHKPFAQRHGIGHVTDRAPNLASHRSTVQWHIVKNGLDFLAL